MDGAPLRVLVVGAGTSGLQAASVVLKAGIHTVVILEAQGEAGGHLLHVHPQTKFRAPWFDSQLLGFTWPTSLQPSGSTCTYGDLLAYTKSYVAGAGLENHCRFHSQVVGLDWIDGKWVALYIDLVTSTRCELDCDFVILCTGRQGVPHVPDIPGVATYQGLQMHSHAFTDVSVARGRSVAVVGSNQAALDCTSKLVLSQAPKSVVMICKTPHWVVPEDSRARRQLLSRSVASRSPFAYYTASTCSPGAIAQRMGHAMKAPATKVFWRTLMAQLSNTSGHKADAGGGGGAHAATAFARDLVASPDGDALAADVTWAMLLSSNKHRAVQGEVVGMADTGLELADGEHVSADLVIWATGYQLPSYATMLQPAVHARLMAASVGDEGPWLYRHVLSPACPSLAFVGCEARTPTPIATSGLQALWVAGVLSGRVRLPSLGAMWRDVGTRAQWMRGTVLPHHPKRRASSLGPVFAHHYHDQLLQDLGLPPAGSPRAPSCTCGGDSQHPLLHPKLMSRLPQPTEQQRSRAARALSDLSRAASTLDPPATLVACSQMFFAAFPSSGLLPHPAASPVSSKVDKLVRQLSTGRGKVSSCDGAAQDTSAVAHGGGMEATACLMQTHDTGTMGSTSLHPSPGCWYSPLNDRVTPDGHSLPMGASETSMLQGRTGSAFPRISQPSSVAGADVAAAVAIPTAPMFPISSDSFTAHVPVACPSHSGASQPHTDCEPAAGVDQDLPQNTQRAPSQQVSFRRLSRLCPGAKPWPPAQPSNPATAQGDAAHEDVCHEQCVCSNRATQGPSLVADEGTAPAPWGGVLPMQGSHAKREVGVAAEAAAAGSSDCGEAYEAQEPTAVAADAPQAQVRALQDWGLDSQARVHRLESSQFTLGAVAGGAGGGPDGGARRAQSGPLEDTRRHPYGEGEDRANEFGDVGVHAVPQRYPSTLIGASLLDGFTSVLEGAKEGMDESSHNSSRSASSSSTDACSAEERLGDSGLEAAEPPHGVGSDNGSLFSRLSSKCMDRTSVRQRLSSIMMGASSSMSRPPRTPRRRSERDLQRRLVTTFNMRSAGHVQAVADPMLRHTTAFCEQPGGGMTPPAPDTPDLHHSFSMGAVHRTGSGYSMTHGSTHARRLGMAGVPSGSGQRGSARSAGPYDRFTPPMLPHDTKCVPGGWDGGSAHTSATTAAVTTADHVVPPLTPGGTPLQTSSFSARAGSGLFSPSHSGIPLHFHSHASRHSTSSATPSVPGANRDTPQPHAAAPATPGWLALPPAGNPMPASHAAHAHHTQPDSGYAWPLHPKDLIHHDAMVREQLQCGMVTVGRRPAPPPYMLESPAVQRMRHAAPNLAANSSSAASSYLMPASGLTPLTPLSLSTAGCCLTIPFDASGTHQLGGDSSAGGVGAAAPATQHPQPQSKTSGARLGEFLARKYPCPVAHASAVSVPDLAARSSFQAPAMQQLQQQPVAHGRGLSGASQRPCPAQTAHASCSSLPISGDGGTAPSGAGWVMAVSSETRPWPQPRVSSPAATLFHTPTAAVGADWLSSTHTSDARSSGRAPAGADGMGTLGARAHGSVVPGAVAPLPLGVMPPRSSMGAIPATLTPMGLRWGGVGDMGPAWDGGTQNGGGGGGGGAVAQDRLAHLRSLETMASNASLALGTVCETEGRTSRRATAAADLSESLLPGRSMLGGGGTQGRMRGAIRRASTCTALPEHPVHREGEGGGDGGRAGGAAAFMGPANTRAGNRAQAQIDWLVRRATDTINQALKAREGGGGGEHNVKPVMPLPPFPHIAVDRGRAVPQGWEQGLDKSGLVREGGA